MIKLGTKLSHSRADLVLGLLQEALFTELRKQFNYPYMNVEEYAKNLRTGVAAWGDRFAVLELAAACQWFILNYGDRFAHIDCRVLEDAATLLDRELSEDL